MLRMGCGGTVPTCTTAAYATTTTNTTTTITTCYLYTAALEIYPTVIQSSSPSIEPSSPIQHPTESYRKHRTQNNTVLTTACATPSVNRHTNKNMVGSSPLHAERTDASTYYVSIYLHHALDPLTHPTFSMLVLILIVHTWTRVLYST